MQELRKKAVTVTLTGLLVFGAAACGGADEPVDTEEEVDAEATE